MNKGCFRLPREIVTLALENVETFESLNKLMSNFLIVQAECSYMSDEFLYYAYSNIFLPVKNGCPAPEYKLNLSVISDDGKPPYLQLVGVKQL